jgi:diadenosine tetraphosphate (Ap4A) HIT family hydrolase
MFELHPQLKRDCIIVGRFELCQLLLMQDANYPWFILVPMRSGIGEIFQLEKDDQTRLIAESSSLAAALADGFKADKINIAALGNVVPQLHIHHIVRYRNDPAWPVPVWGKLPMLPYSKERIENVFDRLRKAVMKGFEFQA